MYERKEVDIVCNFNYLKNPLVPIITSNFTKHYDVILVILKKLVNTHENYVITITSQVHVFYNCMLGETCKNSVKLHYIKCFVRLFFFESCYGSNDSGFMRFLAALRTQH